MKGSNSSDRLIEVVVPEPSGSSLVDRRQLDKVDGGAWCDSTVRIGFDLFSESKVLLELDRKVLCSMGSAPIPLIRKSRGASKAAQLVSAKKQIDFVRKKGGSIFEEPVVRLANLLNITDNSHDRNGNGSFSFHPFVGPEASYTKPQDARRRRQGKGKTWYATPLPPHPQTSTRFLYRGRQQEAAQGMPSMLKKNKKKHQTAFHALSIGETQRREVCYRRRNEKKKS